MEAALALLAADSIGCPPSLSCIYVKVGGKVEHDSSLFDERFSPTLLIGCVTASFRDASDMGSRAALVATRLEQHMQSASTWKFF